MSLEEASAKFALWRNRPDVFVEEVFHVTPDAWQRDVLQAFPNNQRIALRASKGPGKTCCEAWLAWNFLLTRPFPKIAATSITGENLADNLWTEMSRWQRESPLLADNFTWTHTRIFLNDHPSTWWMSARTWSKKATAQEQGDTLAGLHADYILFLIDESGAIPAVIGASAEAALSSCVEGHIVQAGNTNSLDGMLYKACMDKNGLWYIVSINGDPDDPKRSPRVSMEWAKEQIRMYGRDNPYVLVNVLGLFPSSAFNALIGVEEVEGSMRRDYREHDFSHAPRILGADVARGGADKSVIFPRQGLQAFTPLQYRNIDGTEGAELTARKWKDWEADACFIDDTGGFGASWIDNLRRLGYAPIGVHFAQKAVSPRFANKRTEMIFEAIQWVKDGGALPPLPDLVKEMTETTYTHKGDALIIEPKELIKERIGWSPDLFDALCLTFASPVQKASMLQVSNRHTAAYNPLSPDYIRQSLGDQKQGGHEFRYNPLSLDYIRRNG